MFVGFDGFQFIPRKDGPPDPENTRCLPFAGDQDGGAHVDPALSDPAYDLLKRGQVGAELHRKGKQMPIEGAQLATMREISWELEQSLAPHLGSESDSDPLGP